MTRTPVEILTEAKRILMEGTWNKGLGGVTPPREGYCALTAVGEAELRGKGFMNMSGGASSYLGKAAMDRGFLGVHLFNDAKDTTFNDVIELFDDAIRMAKEAEAA